MSCCNQQSYSAFRNGQNEDTWLRGRASVMLSEGRWFSSPCLHVEVSLGKILNPNLPLMCWSAPRMAAISIWMYVWITVSGFGKKASAKCPKKYWNKNKLCSLAPGKCKRVWFKCGISSQKKKGKKRKVQSTIRGLSRTAHLVPVPSLKPGPALRSVLHFAACHPLSLFGCTFKWRLNVFLKTNLKLVSLICLSIFYSFIQSSSDLQVPAALRQQQTLCRMPNQKTKTALQIKKYCWRNGEIFEWDTWHKSSNAYDMNLFDDQHSSDDLCWGHYCTGAERLMEWITGRDYGLKSLT